MSCNDTSQKITLALSGCQPDSGSGGGSSLTNLEINCDTRQIVLTQEDADGVESQLAATLCPEVDWTIDKDNVVTNYDAAAGTFIVTIPCIDRPTGAAVGSFDLDFSPLVNVAAEQITCSQVAAFISSRDNATNPCIKELVLCAGTADETVVASYDLSGFITGFQPNAANPCILEGILCTGATIPVWDFSKYIINLQANAGDSSQIDFIGCDNSVVGSLTLPTAGSNFSCADLVGNISVRDNAANACIKEVVLCAGSANESVAGTIDLSSFVTGFQPNAANPCILEAVLCDNSTVAVRDFSGYVNGVQANAANPNIIEFIGCDNSVVGSLTLPTAGSNFSCADLVGKISVRDNSTNACIKEVVLCPGDANETVAGSIDTSKNVESFQENAVNDCILEAVLCDGTIVPVKDFSKFATGIRFSTINPNLLQLVGCDGTTVGDVLLPSTGGGSFSCADLVGNISVRDNTINSCVKEIVLCSGTGNETVAGSIDLSSFVAEVEEVVENCEEKVRLKDCTGTTLVDLPSSCKTITQASHGLGSPGDIIPVTSVSGSWAAANTDVDNNPPEIAELFAKVIDGDTLKLSAQFCGTNNTNITSGWVALLPDGTLGSFDDYEEDQELKQAVALVVDGCLFYCKREAQLCPIPSCCDKEYVVDADFDLDVYRILTDVSVRNQPLSCKLAALTLDPSTPSGFRPAVAEDDYIFIAEIVEHAVKDITFRISRSFCKESENPAYQPGDILTVLPTDAIGQNGLPIGSVVPTTSISSELPTHIVGVKDSDNCIRVDVCCPASVPVDPVDPGAPTLAYEVKDDNGNLDLSGFSNPDGFDISGVTQTDIGNGICSTTFPVACSGETAREFYEKVCPISGTWTHATMCQYFGFENTNHCPLFDNGLFGHMEDSGNRVSIYQAGQYQTLPSTDGEIQIRHNSSGAGILIHTGWFPNNSTLYKFTLEVKMPSAVGVNDGEVRFIAETIDGTTDNSVPSTKTVTGTAYDSGIVTWGVPTSYTGNLSFGIWRPIGFNPKKASGDCCLDDTQPAYFNYLCGEIFIHA